MKKKSTSSANHIVLHVISQRSSKGFLRIGQNFFPCALGKNGIKINKVEGDGATPKGTWTLNDFFFRSDKTKRPFCSLKGKALKKHDLWCDDPRSNMYNRHVKAPFKPRAEKLWRKDDQYNLIIVINYNRTPCRKNKGSAIFMHIHKNMNYPPTEGCLAFSKADLIKILKVIRPQTKLHI